jgi:hypothetical protein
MSRTTTSSPTARAEPATIQSPNGTQASESLTRSNAQPADDPGVNGLAVMSEPRIDRVRIITPREPLEISRDTRDRLVPHIRSADTVDEFTNAGTWRPVDLATPTTRTTNTLRATRKLMNHGGLPDETLTEVVRLRTELGC